MQVFRGIDAVKSKLKNPAITIGNFDGVHMGHQALFQRVKQWAEELNGESVVVTFDPHPLEVLFPEKAPPFITSHLQKLDLIASCGIDATIVIPFDHEFSRMSAREFVEVVLVEKIGTRAIVVGHDYRFGHSREGDIPFLRRLGEQYGFKVEIVTGIRMNDTPVSSTSIRQMIAKGNIREANKLLGRPFEVSGTVIAGRKRGVNWDFLPRTSECRHWPRLERASMWSRPKWTAKGMEGQQTSDTIQPSAIPNCPSRRTFSISTRISTASLSPSDS